MNIKNYPIKISLIGHAVGVYKDTGENCEFVQLFGVDKIHAVMTCIIRKISQLMCNSIFR